MQKSTTEIFKELFVIILIATALPILIDFFLTLAGFGTDALWIPREIPTNPAMMEDMGPLSYLPSVDLSVHGIIIILAKALSMLLSTFLSAGLGLGIYRKVKYDTNIAVEDLFFFFNSHFFFNLLVFFVVGLLILLLFPLLIFPAIIVATGLFTYPVILAKMQDDPDRGVIRLLKETWKTTKGYKAMIFGRILIVSIVVGLIFGGINLILVLGLSFANELVANPESFISTFLLPLIQMILAIITSCFIAIADISIYNDLVSKRVFEDSPMEELTEDDYKEIE